ncbi:hypothetical protein EZJ43_05280 [Pedobacter changchengzhani]|uniref:Uncharacterized protein n=1 Tax=Pedobacter changchengzhani TaxID=2529274 RepID=A0A4R5MNL4_9SPHI|nr:hypothetical protein [Pedobacter changchengzhani]TDG36699.1 hypothetical protein EZJ43_05280 [Pedobacter changchengzhani]
MNLKELLLKGQNFIALLNQFRIDAKDLIIKDENLIFLGQERGKNDIVKESVCIEGRNNEGLISLFGTLHYNLLSKLAVFEMQSAEKMSLPN